jgi:hypothetical protein
MTDNNADSEREEDKLEQSLCHRLDERLDLAREITRLRNLLGLPLKYEEEDWIALHGGVDDGVGDILYQLIEHRFCDDEKEHKMMFHILDRDERAAEHEIERLRKLLGP